MSDVAVSSRYKETGSTPARQADHRRDGPVERNAYEATVASLYAQTLVTISARDSAGIPLTKRPERDLIRSRRWFRHALPAALARAGLVGPLPSFLIIGTQRGGTTYLHDLLSDHPWVSPGLVKEIHFFERQYERGLDWYRANFASGRLAARNAQEQTIVGEATANYLFSPCVPQRVHDAMPNVRLIILLRNPTDRAFSHYQMEVGIGLEPLTFEDAIAVEAIRLGVPPGQPWVQESNPSFEQLHYSYLSRGLYAQQLKRWKRLFSDEQILIIKSERLYKETPNVLEEVAEFLEIPSWTPKGKKKTNSLSYSPMNPATRQSLIEFYRPHNEELSDELGISFDWNR